MPCDTYAYFFVRGFENEPDEITQLLGLSPTETWKAGDPGLNGHPRKFNNWKLSSPLPRTERFQDNHLLALLELLEPNATEILALDKSLNFGIQCVGHYTDENSGFHMDYDLIARIYRLGLSVDFDLYCKCSHEEQQT